MTTSENMLPPRPDQPQAPPKKHWTWWKIGLVILGLYIAGSVLADIGSVVDESTSSTPTVTQLDPVAPDSNLELLRSVWDMQSPSDQAAMCELYNTPPVGLTPQMVRIFENGAHLGYAESERVLGIVLAEEC